MKKSIFVLVLALTFLITACAKQTPAEVRETAAVEEEQVSSDVPFDGIIPTIKLDGEEVPLGEKLPPSEIVYDPANPEEMPLFLYTHPENWEEVYRVKGTTRYIAHVGEYYMEVSIWGPVGPVWKVCSYTGVPSGAEPVSVTVEKNVQIDSFYDVDHKMVEGTGVWVEMPEATVSKPEMINIYEEDSVRWYQYRDGRLFFTQKYYGFSPNEAVFYGGINGCMQILHIPFDGEFHRADAYGITYEREGVLYFKSFYRVGINGELNYVEIPACLRAWGLELPKEIMGDSLEDSIEAEMVPPFLAPEN